MWNANLLKLYEISILEVVLAGTHIVLNEFVIMK